MNFVTNGIGVKNEVKNNSEARVTKDNHIRQS